MAERNVARDVSNELLIWGAGDAINNYFQEKKINNYKDWWYRKQKELDRRLTEEQKERLVDFLQSEEDVAFVYRAKSVSDFEVRYQEATGRKITDDGITGGDLFYTKTSGGSSGNPDFNKTTFILLIIFFWPAAIWYYVKHK